MGVKGVRSEEELTELILEKVIAKGMTIMSICEQEDDRQEDDDHEVRCGKYEKAPVRIAKENRISKSTVSRIFHTVRGAQCVSRLAGERTCTAKCWMKETS